MSTRVVINEAGIQAFMAEDGPVGIWLSQKTASVYEKAYQNASGRPGPNPRTRDLLNHLRYDGPFSDTDALFTIVGTDAEHRGFQYTKLIEQGGVAPNGTPYRYPFLEPAVRSEFG